jgi:hypothetical protein
VLWVQSHGQKATAVKLRSLSGVLIQKNHPVLFRTKTEVFECHGSSGEGPVMGLERRDWVIWLNCLSTSDGRSK